jgi:hypothetical protein
VQPQGRALVTAFEPWEKAVYQLLVFYPGETSPRHRFDLRTAVETSARLPELLAEHSGCERIVGMLGTIRLFAVDSAGNRIN